MAPVLFFPCNFNSKKFFDASLTTPFENEHASVVDSAGIEPKYRAFLSSSSTSPTQDI